MLLVGAEGSEEELTGRFLARVLPDASPAWRRSMAVHHDVVEAGDGTLVALAAALRVGPNGESVHDNELLHLSSDGATVLGRLSFWDLKLRQPELPWLEIAPAPSAGKEGIDWFHLNSVTVWREAPSGAPLELLVCSRRQSQVFLVSWEEKRILWSRGSGHLSGPHDASPAPEGAVLVFDNGLERGRSRIVELGALGETRTLVESLDGKPFFTRSRGSVERLESGNLLIAVSEQGRVVEVDTEGEVVWDWRAPLMAGGEQRFAVGRARLALDVRLTSDR